MPETPLTLDQAAALLEVTPDRIQVLVDEGLLDPLPGDGPRRFDPEQVRAVHDLGG
jgi:DNA-binding transcriptional MerR regulator